jgi:hypothetical protein
MLGYTLGRRGDENARANWSVAGLRDLPPHLRERAMRTLADPRL